MLAVDVALEVTIDGGKEILAVIASMEADDVGLQHALAAFRRHGQMPNVSALGHGMCQNKVIVEFGSCSRTSCGSSAKW